MKRFAPKDQIEKVLDEINKNKLNPIPLFGTERTVIAVIGNERKISPQHMRSFPGVSDVMMVLKPYTLAARETKHENTIVNINGVKIGGKELSIMAGPCAVESQEQVDLAAEAINKVGVKILRGGAFKPRTGPYSFEGMEEEGLKILRTAADREKLLVVTEVMDLRKIDLIEKYTDILQVGARNMQNYPLLRELGKSQKPVLLKRGISSTVEEWLLAAEYILAGGNQNLILCERGIRTFEKCTRNTLGINAIPVVKELSHLPLIVDPSHAAGKRDYVPAISKGAIAAGADGLIIEIHPDPEKAKCDGAQSLTFDLFENLVKDLKLIAQAVDRIL